jgi:hypothetical protein
MVTTVPRGSVVLTYPYPVPGHAQAMVWQAVASLRFSLLGGYALIPDAQGVPVLYPSVLAPRRVQQFLVTEEGGDPFPAAAPVRVTPQLIGEFRLFVDRYHVRTVLVDPRASRAGVVTAVLHRALGRAPVRVGGLDVWYHVTAPTRAGSTAST